MLTRILSSILLVACTAVAGATEKQFGEYTIHYSAFKSDFLSSPMAKAYGITRSKNRAVLNITVTKSGEKGLPQPIEADISSKVFNVYQQTKAVNLRKIVDQGSIYYIAEFPVANEEIVNFEVAASQDKNPIGKVTFQQQFFLQ